jgi:hypothetical protein
MDHRRRILLPVFFLVSLLALARQAAGAKRVVVYHRNRPAPAPAPGRNVLRAGRFVSVVEAADGGGELAENEEEDKVVFLFDYHRPVPTPPPTSQPLRASVFGSGGGGGGEGGNGTRIFILDSGCEVSHPAFSRLNVRLGPSFVSAEPDVGVDARGHGTAVLGAAAEIATGPEYTCVRIFASAGASSSSTVALAVDWVARQCTGPLRASQKCIINLSGGGATSPLLNRIADDFVTLDGGAFVAAAGNYVASCDYSPGQAKQVISAGSTSLATPPDFSTGFSATGPCVDVLAPGDGLSVPQPPSGWGTESGTSFSAPVVSAALSLLWARHPFLSTLELRALFLDKTCHPGIVRDVPPQTVNLFVGVPSSQTLGWIDASPWFAQWRAEWSSSSSLCLSATAVGSGGGIWQAGIYVSSTGEPPRLTPRPRDFVPGLIVVSATGRTLKVRLGTKTYVSVLDVPSIKARRFFFDSSTLVVQALGPAGWTTQARVVLPSLPSLPSPTTKLFATFANNRYDPVEVLDPADCAGWTSAPVRFLPSCDRRGEGACTETTTADPALECTWIGPAYGCRPKGWCATPSRNACAALPWCVWRNGPGCGNR